MGKIRALINSKIGVGFVFFLLGVSAGLNKETAVTLLGFYFFPVESEYIFTHDKNFDCSKANNDKEKIVCAAISKINEKISNGELDTKNFGVFEKSFLEFVRGEKSINFYSAKNISEVAAKKFSDGLDSYYERLKFYFWNRSVRKSVAFAVPTFNRIYLSPHFFKNSSGYYDTIIHEILHLCSATEEEVRLLGY